MSIRLKHLPAEVRIAVKFCIFLSAFLLFMGIAILHNPVKGGEFVSATAGVIGLIASLVWLVVAIALFVRKVKMSS